LLSCFDDLVKECDLPYLEKELPNAIDQSLEGLRRIGRIVKAMKEFSHPGSNEKLPADINRAIETTITVARNEWKYVAEVVTDLDPSLPPVPCLQGEFNQVILNLLVNAAHAISAVVGDGAKNKGKITVTTRRVDDSAEITIHDSGTGIPKEIQARIFEPFFTTKPVGKGTGQGLSLAHSTIVKRHRGQIWFESAPGEGTTFFIRLPLHAEAAATASAPATASAAATVG
jgi:signal transduction histidine kinase